MPDSGFFVTKGTPREYTYTADSGKTVTLFSCGKCCSTLWSQSKTFGNTKIVKAGALDGDAALECAKPTVELYTRARPSWLKASPEATQFEEAYKGEV